MTLFLFLSSFFWWQPFHVKVCLYCDSETYASQRLDAWTLVTLIQGVCILESQGKSYQNHQKSGMSGKVREFEKNVVPGQGKSGKIVLPKYLIRVVN